MNINEYVKRPETVTASDPISDDNVAEIAAWCGGTVVRATTAAPGRPGRRVRHHGVEVPYVLVVGAQEAVSGDRVALVTDAAGVASFVVMSDEKFRRLYAPADLVDRFYETFNNVVRDQT